MAALCVCAAVTLVVMPSCNRVTSRCHSENTRYVQLDSMFNSITDADSLAALAKKFHDQDDALGEFVALKYYGRALRHNSHFDQAIAAHEQGLEIATSVGDTLGIVTLLNCLGADYRRQGNLSKANGFYFKALQLGATYSQNDCKECFHARVMVLNGIGNIELELRHYVRADSLLHESFRGAQSLGSYRGMAINCSDLGKVKRAQGDMDSAWIFHRESLKFNQLMGRKDGVALCHLNFGELFADERNYSHAQVEFKQAYDEFKEMGDTYNYMDACLQLAAMDILLGETEEARRYVQEAETEALRINSMEHQARVYHTYYDLAMKEGDAKRALEFHLKSDEMYDSIYGLEKNNELRHQIAGYEASIKQGEMDTLNRDIKRLNRTRNLMSLFISLLVLMAGAIIAALIYASRIRSRTQRLMRQVEETRSLFFTNVVHQLRTPLTAIMGATDNIVAQSVADDDGKAASQRKYVEIIKRQGRHLLLLVDRILEVGSVRSALKGPDWRTGDVVGFLRMIVESYREQCLDQQIELTYFSTENEVKMDIVPHYINTIVGNIIENAISYSNDYCKVAVTSQVVGDDFVIKVADNGIGIAADDLPHVFEPFYRAALAEQMCEGIGIGLTVVRDMVSVLGGSVDVESVPGNGSVFTVVLPLSSHRNEAYGKLEMVVKPVRNVVRKRHDVATDDTVETAQKERADVLVVEDHNDVARLVGAALGPDFGVHYASNGEQGLELAARLMPDLIITDVKMPYVDGLEMCRRVRASRRLRHIPIIMLSARTSEADRIRGIEAGADAYLIKPFSSDELKVWATKLLENRKILRDSYSSTASIMASQNVESISQMDDEELLAAFAELLDERIAGGAARLNLGEIAVQLKMGESQLRHRIQSLTGKNVSAYVTQLRMEKAMRLLRENPTMLIGDIAEQCGFSDVAYFSRVFRQYYKMTPTRARNGSPD